MIETLDKNVGRLMNTLKQMDIDDNTLVIFTSDNGGVGGVTGIEPLRGYKGMLYEGGIRVPLIVRWKGKIKGGTSSDQIVSSIDFYPTFLEITKEKSAIPLDGISLLPVLLHHQQLQERNLFWHFPAYLEASRLKKKGNKWRTTPAGAIRKGNWKLIQYFEENRLELYNLKKDTGEIHNLAKENPQKSAELYQDLQTWQKKVNAPIPTERNKKYQPDVKMPAS